jgi:iron only hydrogenase large subunit-like protein
VNSPHSVGLDKDRCVGCTTCIKTCPTQAIRVRKGKARIIEERCIDCGECIRVCPKYAKISITQSLDQIRDFRYPVALVSPALYGQFPLGTDISLILTGFLELGFKRVIEVARGAEYMGHFIRDYIKQTKVRPLISSVCPAVTRLIRVRYPELAEHVIPIAQPMEIMARLVRERMIREGYPEDEIGFFYITPCTANATSVRLPIGFDQKIIHGAIGISEIFWPLYNIVKGLQKSDIIPRAGSEGIHWASIGGESRMLGEEYRCLAIDGLGQLIGILDSLSIGKLHGIDFIEARACIGGCVGGALNLENTYVAKEIIRRICKQGINKPFDNLEENYAWQDFQWTIPLGFQRSFQLDSKPEVAMLKMEAVDDILKKLPGMDCGACGAPNCRTLAEDIVQDQADQMDCIFVFRQRVTSLAEDMIKISRKLPISMQTDESEE